MLGEDAYAKKLDWAKVNLFWVDEAQTISFDSLKTLTPTLREADSQIWLSGNPRSSTDAFSERFIKFIIAIFHIFFEYFN